MTATNEGTFVARGWMGQAMERKRRRAQWRVTVGCWTWALCAGAASGGDVFVTLEDGTRHHVHPAGSTFEVDVTVTAPGDPGATITASWVDAHWRPLADAVVIEPGVVTTLRSPGMEPGYYGLVFDSDHPDVAFPPQAPGFGSHHFGFAILPPRPARQFTPDSAFGMVHAAQPFDDPCIAGWTKTLTWNTVAARWWDQRIQEVEDAGLCELPVVSGATWDQDDDFPIGEPALQALADKFRAYLLARPAVTHWELGIEENIRDRYDHDRYYFPNLRAKVERMREVADDVAPHVCFVINTVGFDAEDHRRLFESDAMDFFDVYSSHPYRWPDFPTPETWLVDHVGQVRTLQEDAGRDDLAFWFTEFGLPVRGPNDPDAFFGYPESGNEVPGATLDHQAVYLVKGHALARHAGVDRIFLYNYRNRGTDITYAEDWFGLRTYAEDSTDPGHPLPSYVAYAQLVHLLESRSLARSVVGEDGLFVFDFHDDREAKDGEPRVDTLVVWSHPESQDDVPLSRLRPDLDPESVFEVLDVYGTPQESSGETLNLTPRPIFIRVERTLTARFDADVQVGEGPLEVQFTDRSRGDPSAWTWDLGDGTVHYEPNPVHAYTDPGRYTVSLAVSRDGEHDEVVERHFVHVHGSMRLSADDLHLRVGERLTMHAAQGPPRGRVALRVLVGSAREAVPIEFGQLDDSGEWDPTPRDVPPGLSGLEVTFDAAAFGANEVTTSNPVTITFE